MQKSITIQTNDSEIANKADALRLLNDFKMKGFKTRPAFVKKVCEVESSLNNYDDIEALKSFWNFRNFSLNERLEQVLKKL